MTNNLLKILRNKQIVVTLPNIINLITILTKSDHYNSLKTLIPITCKDNIIVLLSVFIKIFNNHKRNSQKPKLPPHHTHAFTHREGERESYNCGRTRREPWLFSGDAVRSSVFGVNRGFDI